MKDTVKVDTVCTARSRVTITPTVYLVKWAGNTVCTIGAVLRYFEGETKRFCPSVGY